MVEIMLGFKGQEGDKKIIENYIKKQGREEDIKQLKLFELQMPCALGTGQFTFFIFNQNKGKPTPKYRG